MPGLFFQFLYFVHIWLCLLPYLVVRLTISAAPHDDGGMDIFSKVCLPSYVVVSVIGVSELK